MIHGNVDGILDGWGKSFVRERGDLPAAGSPERSVARMVLDAGDGTYLLENVAESLAERKEVMAGLQDSLEGKGLSVAAPLKSSGGGFLYPFDESLWQLTPYVSGVPLDQTTYIHDAWRGEAVAGFLLGLRQHTLDGPYRGGPAFDLPEYIDNLMIPIKANRPKVFEALQEANAFLEERLNPHWNSLPTALAHGDTHGVNIIWGESDIRAVIDWEFFGEKPLLYDVANMIGCCGMENPKALLNGLVPALISSLKPTHFADTLSWSLLPELVMALRYAWLSEWLRKEDTEMINLELSYIYLLMDNRDKVGAP